MSIRYVSGHINFRLGFLNPWLYSLKTGLTDIVHGESRGCFGSWDPNSNTTKYIPHAGWNATEGWDPVTGLGTPVFSELLEAALALP